MIVINPMSNYMRKSSGVPINVVSMFGYSCLQLSTSLSNIGNVTIFIRNFINNIFNEYWKDVLVSLNDIS